MPLFELGPGGVIGKVPATTFAAEGIKERSDLQRALRDNIADLDKDLFVVAEEFGDFDDAPRRIDLLCIHRSGHLVVVELKRTDDGGHMELQALRYAAMVSAMTFDQLVETYERHVSKNDLGDVSAARTTLLEWLAPMGEEDFMLSREVKILLVSAGFDPQITTTVLWLREIYGLDISCLRLVPYNIDSKIILDVQQVIPLPEAAELTVQLRRREVAKQVSEERRRRDWTQYVVVTPEGRTEPLRKRHAILSMVESLHRAGVSAEKISAALPGYRRFWEVDGTLTGDDLKPAFATAYPQFAQKSMDRFFFSNPLHENEKTWVLANNWGPDTVEALDALLGLAPAGFSYEVA